MKTLNAKISPFGIMTISYLHNPIPAFTPQVLKESIDLLKGILDTGLYNNVEVRAIVVKSKFPKIFHAGGDISLFVKLLEKNKSREILEYGQLCIVGLDIFRQVSEKGIVTISIVEGNVLGGGIETLLATDYTIMNKKYKLMFPEVKFNLFPGMGAFPMLKHRLGSRLAKKIVNNGDWISAGKASELNIIDKIIDKKLNAKEEKLLVEQIIREKEQGNIECDIPPLEDLYKEIYIWRDSLMGLNEDDLLLLKKIVKKQRGFSIQLVLKTIAVKNKVEVFFENII